MWLASQPGGMGSPQACEARPAVPMAIARTPQRKLVPIERMSTPPGTMIEHCNVTATDARRRCGAQSILQSPGTCAEGSDRDETAVHRSDRLRLASGDADGAGAHALSRRILARATHEPPHRQVQLRSHQLSAQDRKSV